MKSTYYRFPIFAFLFLSLGFVIASLLQMPKIIANENDGNTQTAKNRKDKNAQTQKNRNLEKYIITHKDIEFLWNAFNELKTGKGYWRDVGTKTNAPLLIMALNNQNKLVRYRAVSALGYHKDEMAIPYLREKMKDEKETAYVRYNIFCVLAEKYNDKESLPYFRKCLSHKNPEIRQAALVAVSILNDKNSLNKIREIVRKEKNIDTLIVAISCLRDLGDSNDLNTAHFLRHLCYKNYIIPSTVLLALKKKGTKIALEPLRNFIKYKKTELKSLESLHNKIDNFDWEGKQYFLDKDGEIWHSMSDCKVLIDEAEEALKAIEKRNKK